MCGAVCVPGTGPHGFVATCSLGACPSGDVCGAVHACVRVGLRVCVFSVCVCVWLCPRCVRSIATHRSAVRRHVSCSNGVAVVGLRPRRRPPSSTSGILAPARRRDAVAAGRRGVGPSLPLPGLPVVASSCLGGVDGLRHCRHSWVCAAIFLPRGRGCPYDGSGPGRLVRMLLGPAPPPLYRRGTGGSAEYEPGGSPGLPRGLSSGWLPTCVAER